MASDRRRTFRFTGVLLTLLCCAASLRAQATITGRITAAEGGQPIAGARVIALGTPSNATTAEDGKYTLRNIPAGKTDIQVLAVGHKPVKKSLTVAATDTTTVDFQLVQSLVQLPDVVISATGELTRRVELGNAISTLGDVANNVQTKPINNVTDMTVGKVASVVVLPSPVLGGAPTVRIRGISSVSLSNAPIWVVDGVRYSTNTATSAGQTPVSLLNNLSPDEIEDIEIVKGPSAATLYGTNAANGVIVVTTKKGRAGKARWNYSAETRSAVDRNDYPDSYALWGHTVAAPTLNRRCQLSQMNTASYTNPNLPTTSQCVGDSLTTYNVLEDPSNTVIGIGRGTQANMNVTGGTDAVRYFGSADYNTEFGPIKMPAQDIDYFQSVGANITNEMIHPRQQQTMNFRSNLSATVNPKLDLNFNAGYGKSYNIIEPDNSLIIALIYTGEAGYGYKGCPATPTASGTPIPANSGSRCGLDKPYAESGTGIPLHDYNSFAPGGIMQFVTPINTQRFTGSSDANWRPLTWMQNDMTIGIDLSSQDVYHVCRLNECPPQGATSRLGNVSDFRENRRNFSLRGSSTGTWQYSDVLNFKTTLGADYTNEERENLSVSGNTLPPGASSLGAVTVVTNWSATFPTANKTLGLYLQESATLHDRLFLTLAARQDENSAFGTDFQHILYPKASVSWIVSEEDFFPKFSFLDQLRLRSAYGANGVQPGSTTAFQSYSSTAVTLTRADQNTGTDVAGLVNANPGNPALKPEKSAELELGFESDLMNRRFHVGYTYYNKKTHDALISVPIAASTGPSVTSLLQNVGSSQNKGHELDINAQVLSSRFVNWDMTVSASHNTNQWLELGIDPATGKERIIGDGNQTQQRQGYPLNAQWFKSYRYNDANGDGIIQQCGNALVAANAATQTCNEVFVDSALFNTGYNVPRDLVSIQNGFDLFNRKLRLNAAFDYRGGGNTLDETNGFDCTSVPLGCAETQDNATALWLQARAVAATYGSMTGDTNHVTGVVTNPIVNKSALGYYQSDQFWRFREFSAVYQLPPTITRWLKGQNGSTLAFGIRNVHLWTKFTGPDPEANYGVNGSESQNEFNTAPQPTYYTLRLNLKY
jgi:TonB-linked SusC/RagA family outer membrane protein